MDEQTEHHEEKITCPDCGEVQTARVLHTAPWWTYVHKCRKCGYTIMESEWMAEVRNE